MVKPNMQRLKVTIEFSYEAEVFDGDPTDAYEIAKLEAEALSGEFDGALSSVVGYTDEFSVRIQPD